MDDRELEQEEENLLEEPIEEVYPEDSLYEENDEEIPQQRQQKNKFGAKEYANTLKDKEYYKNKGQELKEKTDAAKKERRNSKKAEKGESENQEEVPRTKDKNIKDKTKDLAKEANAKKNELSNKIGGLKAQAHKYLHPVEAGKAAAKEAVRKKVMQQVSAKLIQPVIAFFLTPPGLIILGIVAALLIFFFIVTIVLFHDQLESASKNTYNLSNSDSFEYNGTFSYFLGQWEGLTDPCTIDGLNGYLAVDIEKLGTTVTVGPGLTNAALNNASVTSLIEQKNMQNFFNYNGTSYYMNYGDCIPVPIVEDIEYLSSEITYRQPLKAAMAEYGVNLFPHQEDALVSFNYNLGPGYSSRLIEEYVEGGYEGLWNYMKQFVKSGGQTLSGLQKRRKGEFALFVTGDYTDQGIFYSRDLTNYNYYDSENVMAREFDPTVFETTQGARIQLQGLSFGNIFSTPKYCTSIYGGGHNGLDFAAAAGTEMFAVENGVVSDSRYQSSWGYTVQLDHSAETTESFTVHTRYAHMVQASHLKVGDYVRKGDLVGYTGNTGYSFGNHLHFEVYIAGTRKNPADYINLNAMAITPSACG